MTDEAFATTVLQDPHEVPPPSMSMLAADLHELCIQDEDINPLEVDSDGSRAFLERVDNAALDDLCDMVAASSILDCLYAPRLRATRTYAVLHGKVRSFIERFPQLLEMGWVHGAGTVADLMDGMREQRTTQGVTMH